MKGCRPWTPDEVSTILKNCSGRYANRNRAMIAIGVSCGFRISELLSLKIRDVAHKYQATGFVSCKMKNTSTKRHRRTMQLQSFAKEHLNTYLAELKLLKKSPSSFLFQTHPKSSDTNKPISRDNAYRIIVDESTKNGIYGNIGSHSMRKTFTALSREFLQEMHRKGAQIDPDKALQSLGGWNHRDSMEKYIKGYEDFNITADYMNID